MENNTFAIINPLLEELGEDPKPARVDKIAQQLEPFKKEAVPLLKKMLNRRRGYVGSNALEVLAILGDPSAILAMLRFVEKEPGWSSHLFEVLTKTIKAKDEETRKKINAQLISYLIKGPKTPLLKPFDPAKSQRDFMKSINALKKVSGVKELDEEATQMVEELKEGWIRPPDIAYLAEEEKERIAKEQNIIIKVIDILQTFDGLQDPRAESVLESYIKPNRFDSLVLQYALTALAMKSPVLAASHLDRLIPLSGKQPNITTRLISNRMDEGRKSIDFSICVREKKPNSKERPYSFKLEKGRVFFLARGEENHKWFVRQAPNKDEAIQVALKYLERWIPEIDSMNAGNFGIINHWREYTGHIRYTELTELLQKYLDFERWGFQESYISPKHCPVIIYDSEWCRVKFHLYIDGNHAYDQKDHIAVCYGRLHAPNNEHSMNWNGEKYQCWHWDYQFLPFLDGTPPQNLAGKFSESPIVEHYKQSEFAQNSAGSIEWEIGKQATLWEHYGQRLFELFDLRHPELWEEYVQYRTEYETSYAKKLSRAVFLQPKVC